jgi:hypothetical protein
MRLNKVINLFDKYNLPLPADIPNFLRRGPSVLAQRADGKIRILLIIIIEVV